MKTSQTVAYIRVSTEKQNLDRQDEITRDANKVFEEKASAGTRDRPVLNEMITYVREGDEVIVWSMDRLARSLIDLISIVQELTAKGVTVTFKKENLSFSAETDDPFSMLTLQIMGAFGEFERTIMKQRQREGIAKAKDRGAYKGRKKITLTGVQLHEAQVRLNMGVPKTRIAKDLGVSRTVLDREMSERLTTI